MLDSVEQDDWYNVVSYTFSENTAEKLGLLSVIYNTDRGDHIRTAQKRRVQQHLHDGNTVKS